MSKIEKALNRTRQAAGGPQVAPRLGLVQKPTTGTSLVPDGSAHPETIGRMASRESRLLGEEELARLRIIDINDAGSPVVQVFRGLRTRIMQASKGANAIVLVTGVTQGSGSSFVAQNLAAAFAFDVAKTALVIDCNFRSPGPHPLLGKTAPGLIDYLQTPSLDIDQIIHPVGVPRLRLIPAGTGPTRQAEFFTSAKMQRLMDSVRSRYAERFVVLDAPPMMDVADVQILSEFADFVLLVVRHARATHGQIDNCLRALGDKKLTGIVFNDEPGFPWRPAGRNGLRSGRNGEGRTPGG